MNFQNMLEICSKSRPKINQVEDKVNQNVQDEFLKIQRIIKEEVVKVPEVVIKDQGEMQDNVDIKLQFMENKKTSCGIKIIPGSKSDSD